MIRTDRLAGVTLALVAHSLGCGGGGGSSDAPDTRTAQDSGADTLPPPDDTTPPDTGPPFQPADHDPFPQLPPGDGVVLTPPRIVTIVADNETLGSSLADFADQLHLTKWWKAQAAIYGLDDPTTASAIGPAITVDMSSTQIHTYIRNLITTGDVPPPDGHTVYVVYLPEGINYVFSSGAVNTNCRLLGGAHRAFSATTSADDYAWVQRCAPDATGGLDSSTVIASHEIIESLTDPLEKEWALPAPATTTPWTSDVWGTMDRGVVTEDGDLCEGTLWSERGFLFQRNFSNDAAATEADPCVPAIPDAWFDVSPSAGWTAIAPGGSVDIALTAWSSAPSGDWRLDIYENWSSVPGELKPTIRATRMGKDFSGPFPMVNNGETATLHVTAPSTAKSGDFAAFAVESRLLVKGTDDYHQRPVGVYVP